MNSNVNLVKKPKDDEDDELDEEIEETSSSDSRKSSSSDDFAKGRMFKFMGIILGVTIFLLVILFMASLFSKHTYTYTEIESVLEDAAKSYFKQYPESLPKNEGSIIEIDSANLSANGDMKDLSEYLKEGDACTGKVQVEMSGTDYLYTPYLNCGESYATVELYKKIVQEGKIVSSGYGLYSSNGAYVYRGEEVDNYVKLGKGLWRIVKVTSNNNIMLISNEGTLYGQQWDNRYNEGKLYEAGINQYSVSRIKDYLEKIYNNPSAKKEDGEQLLSKKDKTMLIPFNLCTGKRSQNSTGKDNSLECTEVMKNQKIGLLTLSDYMFASLDPNCKTAVSKSCKNYNYLSQHPDWWLLTADKDDNSQVFQVNQSGKVTSELAGSMSGVRPVVLLNSKVLYKSGNGTEKKPYKVK